jgi:hypothetical protein
MRIVICSQIHRVVWIGGIFFNQVLTVHGVHDVRHMDIHMAEPLVPEPSLVEVEIAIGKLRRYKSLGTDQILAKLNKARDEILCSEIHKFIRSTWNKRGIATAVEGIYYCTSSSKGR